MLRNFGKAIRPVWHNWFLNKGLTINTEPWIPKLKIPLQITLHTGQINITAEQFYAICLQI